MNTIFSHAQRQLGMRRAISNLALILLSLLALSACNPKDSSSSAPALNGTPSTGTATTNSSTPTAATDGNKAVRVGSAVTLDASASQDPDGGKINYNWAFVNKPEGSTSELSDPDSPQVTFTPDLPGDYEVEVEVVDDEGDSDSQSSTVEVSETGPTTPTAIASPTANAGADQNVSTSSLVRLDGSASLNADGGLLSYEWRFVSRPAGSGSTISDPVIVNPTFTPDADGEYTLALVVREDGRNSQEDLVVVTSSTANSAPVAYAGVAQSVSVGSLVQLDGSASTDADGDSLSYAWSFVSRPSSSTAVINNASAANPNFVTDAAGDYTLSLIVNDGSISSRAAQVAITATRGNSAPTAGVSNNFSTTTGTRVSASGATSSDPEGDSLSYTWTLVSTPAGSAASLSNSRTVSANITPDVDGSYVLQLVVSDGALSSAPARVTITSSTTNSAPNANAGADQTVATGNRVYLNGIASSDPDGDAITYQWSLTSRAAGSGAVIDRTYIAQPSFLADRDGTYVAELVVSDGAETSTPDRITVSATSSNSAPIANAGANQSTTTGTTISLNGTGSSDANGDVITYSWTLSTRPAGSATSLSSSTSSRPSLRPDVDGTYVARLVVSDGSLNSNPDTVSITASGSNGAPTASAGGDQAVSVGSRVYLNGNGSSDPNGDSLSHQWSFDSRPAGSSAAFANANIVQPNFTPDVAGVYRVRLTVNDGRGGEDFDLVTVTSSAGNSAPTADAGANQNLQVGDVAYLSANGSSDPDGDSLTYAWSITSRPSGSGAILSSTNQRQPSFVADVAGTYSVRLVVNDGALNSPADTVAITAVSGNVAPIAEAGSNQNVNTGTTVYLSGSSSSDADGDSLNYSWSITNRPSGSSATLNSATLAQPSFSADVAGSYVIRLVVNDGQASSSADTLTVTATTPGGGGGGGGGGSVTDAFDGNGALINYVTNNASALPNVARVGGRYRAELTDNTGDKTLHFNTYQGRLDAKLVSFPFEYIAYNIGIGTQANSQVAPNPINYSFMFAGVQVHVEDLNSRNSSHIVVGHRGDTRFTIEGKNTVNGSSSVNDDGANVLPTGRADIRIVGDSSRNLRVYWRAPNSSGSWRAYRGSGQLPGSTPSYGSQVYIGLITYAYRDFYEPFVGTADGVQLVGE